MKKASLPVFALLLLLALNLGCQPSSSREGAQSPTTPTPPRQSVQQTTPQAPASPAVALDAARDEAAALMSGLAVGSETAKKLEGTAAWQAFAKSINGHWDAFNGAILEPMKAWAGEDLRASRLATKTLFYPFGGPDFVTSFAFWPDAAKTVLMGLESAGNFPDFGQETAEWTDGFFKDFEAILSDFLKRGYFVTEHMNEAYGKGRVDGALPVIGFFLKRTGHSIVGLKRLSVNENGEWVEAPYTTIRRLLKRPSGVRVDYVKTGGSNVQSVYYFSCDLADPSFAKTGPLFRLFSGLEGVTTFVKSGSYLLHYGDFANLRNLILEKSLYVLEDDTGVPYRYFKRQGWGIQLYGAYAKPVEDFPAIVEQKDLQAAYEDPSGNVKKLPFHFGYRWVSKVDNLLLMTRPPGKPGVS